MNRLVWLALLVGCGTSTPGKSAYFDLSGPVDDASTFWNLPFPSDLRLDASGAPDITGYPNPRDVPILQALLSVVPARRGWPVMPVAYFRFTDAPPDKTI